jgi:hypothetical protein
MKIAITDAFLIEQIKGNRYVDYLRLFANSKPLLDEIVKEERELVNKANLQKLKALKNFKGKIRAIYNKEGIVAFDEEQVNKPVESKKVECVSEVIEIQEEKYKDWFNDFCRKNSNILMYNVCYNSKKDCYVVTTKYFKTK